MAYEVMEYGISRAANQQSNIGNADIMVYSKVATSFTIFNREGKRAFLLRLEVISLFITDTIYRIYVSLIIGKMYHPAMLGFYNRGQQFPSIMVSNIDSSIQSVMFPVLASQQSNRPRVKDMMRRAIVTSSFFVFP
jgi:O-antigen/teichoic acid export membrane protein